MATKKDLGEPLARTCIFILGMHRSGTSALARILNLLGCDMPKELMLASPSNPHGHWESSAIMQVNDAILASGGSSWHDWIRFNPSWYNSPVYRDFLDKGRSAIQQEFGNSSLFVLKDPRSVKLVRFWRDVFQAEGITPKVVIPIRNPAEVAASILSRDNMPVELVHLIWLSHVLDAEYESRELVRDFSTYEELLDEWLALAERLQRSLDIAWPRFSAMSIREITASLDADSRHHVRQDKKILSSPDHSHWLRETYRIMLKWAKDGEDKSDYQALDQIRQEFDAAGPAFAAIAHDAHAKTVALKQLETRLNAMGADVQTGTTGEILTELENVRAALAEKEEAARMQEEAVSAMRLEAEALALQLEEARAGMGRGEDVQSSLMAEIEALRAQLATEQSTLAQRCEEIDQTRAELQAEQERSRSFDVEHERLVAKLSSADQWVFRLAGEKQAASVEIGRLSSIIQARESELRTLKILAENALSSKGSLQIQVNDLSERLDISENENQDIRAALHRFEQKMPTLAIDHAALEDKLSEARREIAKLTEIVLEHENSQSPHAIEIGDSKSIDELSSMLKRREEEIDTILATSAKSEQRMKDRANELAQLSNMLRLRESEVSELSVRREWLQQVVPILTHTRWWWLFMPKSWRLERRYRKLERKGLFNKLAYLDRYPDVAHAGIDPVHHYITHGMAEGRTL